MKLFVRKPHGEKVYLDSVASSRSELAQKLGSQEFTVPSVPSGSFDVTQVEAEPSPYYNIPTASALGLITGLLIGPVGAIIGSIAGGVIGWKQGIMDMEKAELFNKTSLPDNTPLFKPHPYGSVSVFSGNKI